MFLVLPLLSQTIVFNFFQGSANLFSSSSSRNATLANRSDPIENSRMCQFYAPSCICLKMGTRLKRGFHNGWKSTKICRPQDVVLVQNNSKKGENPCRCSKFPLHKNFKLILDQNVSEQIYPEISSRSQKCSVQSLIQSFILIKLNFDLEDVVK